MRIVKMASDNDRVSKIAQSFLSGFNEYDLETANKQLEETVRFCELNAKERQKLFSIIKKKLSQKNISLDYLESY